MPVNKTSVEMDITEFELWAIVLRCDSVEIFTITFSKKY
jgi:hypothetical protein